MPTPKTHYRIALGENNGQHSWIIHSSKGITWHNIPDELVTLLQKLTVNQLLDFSLGSDGRWFVRYRQKGPEKQELSPYLWMDLNQGSNVKLDRLTLGPDADHWGVHKAADGSFQRFRSVGNRDKFTALLDPKTDQIKSNNQIWFVSLGFRGDWAFSVNGYVQHRCGKPFHTELSNGWKVKKKVSTIALSPMARVWIIVWEDGTLSHNLPTNIANEVEDYCQIQYSLKKNGGQSNSQRPKAKKPKPQRNNPKPAPTNSSQTQQPPPNPAQPVNTKPTPNAGVTTAQPSAAPTVQTTNRALNVTSASAAQTIPTPIPPPRPTRLTANVVPATSIQTKPATTSSQYSSIKAVPSRPSTLSQVPNAPPAVKSVQLTNPPRTMYFVPAVHDTANPVQRDRPGTRIASQVNRPGSRVEPTSEPARVYVPPRKLTTTLRLLDPSAWGDQDDYYKIRGLFNEGWQHLDRRCPRIKRIYVVQLPDHLKESYDTYKAFLKAKNGWDGVNEKLVFHGTSRRCSLADIELNTDLCSTEGCGLCSILRTSFLVSKAGSAGRTFKRFGPGIYTSSVSSKADDYSKEPLFSANDTKVVIVARVALGKASVHYRTTEELTCPPYGYDSVLGEVGIHLNYDEQVLYKDEAIRPAYVVVYDKPTPVPQTTTAPAATRPRPVQTQTYTTYNPFQSTTTTSRPAQTTTTNWLGQTTATTTNSSSSSGCIIM